MEYITDESGNVVNRYAYDAFGSIISSSETISNRYTYNGEAYDKATEQYYLRKRYYNPKLSRFIQEDEYRGDGLNLYAFCANNPVMYVDPSGYVKKVESTNPDIIDIINRTTNDLKYPGTIPTNATGFDSWYNSINFEELKTLYSDSDVADLIKDRLRSAGGVHEWFMVAEAPATKKWGVTAEMVKVATTKIESIQFVDIETKKFGVQSGHHGNKHGAIEA